MEKSQTAADSKKVALGIVTSFFFRTGWKPKDFTNLHYFEIKGLHINLLITKFDTVDG